VFKHIVVGCDGTPEGRDAVALGEAVASATGATLSLVGVYPPTLFPTPGLDDRKTLRAQATRTLRRERDLLAPDALIHILTDTSVPRALRRSAQRWHADLVIIGSNRSAPPGHVAIGRRGRQLLNGARFGLGLPVRGLQTGKTGIGWVGVGYDGGPEAEAALALAAELARAADARLLVRTVVEDRIPPLTGQEWMTTKDWNHAHLWDAARQTALVETQAAAQRLDMPAEVSATVGDPGYELRALSQTVDVLVVGSRRWGPIARLVTGGVGETLVADASCSILIVPRAQASDRGSAGRQREHRPAVA
jgi:nucleotide-binding universal stress UspA family protein